MTMKTVKLENGETITLEHTSLLGKGGEGKVYRIVSPSQYANTHCIKIYNEESKAASVESKIGYMIRNIPQTPSYVRLCWPEAKVFYRGKFRGYLMPLAFEESRNLYEIIPLNFYQRQQLPQAFKKDFDRSKQEGILARMKLSVHMAAAFHAITATGKYVIVDMKPDNVLFTATTKVSIVDCDSFQVTDKSSVLYRADVCTEEYAPPEYYGTNKVDKKEVFWDYFTFSILVYQLMYGVHPFAATFKAPYDKEHDLPSKIRAGLFVHGGKSGYLTPLPSDHPHQKFKLLPDAIKRLWTDTLDSGLYIPHKRTSFYAFGEVFSKVIVDAQSKKKISQYFGLTAVPSEFVWDWKKIIDRYRLGTVPILYDILVQKYTKKMVDASITIYVGTGLITMLMIFFYSIMHGNGFWGVVWGMIKGAFLGVIGGAFWPILLIDIPRNWYVLYPLVGMVLFSYYYYFRQERYEKIFYVVSSLYGFIVFLTFLGMLV